jgi:hypothetical protein
MTFFLFYLYYKIHFFTFDGITPAVCFFESTDSYNELVLNFGIFEVY